LERGGWSVVGCGLADYLKFIFMFIKFGFNSFFPAYLVEQDGCYCLVQFSFHQTTTNNAPTVKPEAPSAAVRF
jgi:hypothetical protein